MNNVGATLVVALGRGKGAHKERPYPIVNNVGATLVVAWGDLP
jgi:hypothetical protein